MERFDVYSFDGQTFLVDEAGIFYLKEDGLNGLGSTRLNLKPRIPFGLPQNISLSDPRRFRDSQVMADITIDRKPISVFPRDLPRPPAPPKVIPIRNVKPLGRPKPDFLNSFANLAKQVGSIFGKKQELVRPKRPTTATFVPSQQPVNRTPQVKEGGISKTAIIGITGLILIGGAFMMKKKTA